ncbi:hypothetical protein Tco_0884528, partial [Tanacetum coccineum]
IMEYLVNISKRRAFWSLNEDILKINDSDNQYAVSIKEDTAYPLPASPRQRKQAQYAVSREDQYAVLKIYITVNGKNAYELKGKFLDDLHNNAFSGTNGKDANTGVIRKKPLNFKIETNVFDYETPLCLAFNEFNYLLKVDPDLLTKDIMGFKTYEDYKDDWIYEWNENVPWVYDKPWLDNGIWKEPKPREDGYCNGGNLPGAYHIGNSLHYQDLEWYEALEDSKLKDE